MFALSTVPTGSRILFFAFLIACCGHLARGASYYYDTAGHLIKVDYGATGLVLYAYDKAGNLTGRQVQTSPTVGTTPTITSVLNAESGQPTIAPNTWVAVYGTNLAPTGISHSWQADDFVGNQLPTQLSDVSVTIGGKRGFVYYVSPTQVNILTPPDPMPEGVSVQLTVGGSTSPALNVPAKAISPSFFVLGGGLYVNAVHSDATLVGPNTLYPGISTPAKPGEVIILFATGFGPTSVPVTAGSLVQTGTLSSLPVVTIGKELATVQFAGLISPGLYQINVLVPPTAANGDNAIVATYAGLSTQVSLLITVKK